MAVLFSFLSSFFILTTGCLLRLFGTSVVEQLDTGSTYTSLLSK